MSFPSRLIYPETCIGDQSSFLTCSSASHTTMASLRLFPVARLRRAIAISWALFHRYLPLAVLLRLSSRERVNSTEDSKSKYLDNLLTLGRLERGSVCACLLANSLDWHPPPVSRGFPFRQRDYVYFDCIPFRNVRQLQTLRPALVRVHLHREFPDAVSYNMFVKFESRVFFKLMSFLKLYAFGFCTAGSLRTF